VPHDIQDIAKSSNEEGDWARLLALDYNDACRGDSTYCTLEQLNARIMQSASQLTTANAKALWHHGVEGGEWIYPIEH
jgi:hypothetical protein